MDAGKQARSAIRKNSIIGTLQTVFGWLLVIFFALAFLGQYTEPVVPITTSDIILYIIMVVGGVLLIYFGARRRQLEKRFKMYVGLISSQRMTSIFKLAQNTGEPASTVIKRLNKMIDMNFFVNAHIDLNRNEILISNGTWQQNLQAYDQTNQNGQSPYTRTNRIITVKCSGCGAVNSKYEGTSSVCEYCGTAI